MPASTGLPTSARWHDALGRVAGHAHTRLSSLGAALDAVVPRWLLVGALLTAMVACAEHELLPLLAWTRRVIPRDRLPLMFGLFFAGYLLQRRVDDIHRPKVLLALSLSLTALFHPVFLVATLAWSRLYHHVLSARTWHGWKVSFLVASFAAWMLACHVPLAPRFHAAHPEVVTWGYVFGASLGFRALWALHQARLGGSTPPFFELLLYLSFAPFFLIVPYMFAIPRLDHFRDSLPRRDPGVERSGLGLIARSALLGVALTLLTNHVWSPRVAFEAALREGALLRAALFGLAYYPGEVTAIAVSGSGIVIGLVRLLGVPLGPSFDRPLAARTIGEWWQRWNTHFRDLLVELCWMPVMLRLRRRPYLSVWAGCASVFLLGSVPLHWLAKHPFHHGSLTSRPVGIVFESLAMTLVVGAGMSWAVWRKRRGHRGARGGVMALALARLRTYALVFTTVVVVGYGATYWFTLRPFEQLQPQVERAQALAARGQLDRAAELLGEHIDELTALARREPLEPLRQSAAAFALALPTAARDLDTARDHLALARTYSDPAAPVHGRWLRAATTLIEMEPP